MKFSFLPILFNLKDIDFELARLRMRTGMLLRQKQEVLKEMTGMNFHNESDIDYHLRETFDPPAKNAKSEHFEVVKQKDFTFKQVGGHDIIKDELMQCSDVLIHYEKYAKYNVRAPKGLILEGPPGNGKTLLAKGFSGELNVGFIPVSGSQFQEKYVGVGAARVRELFDLAKENVPCIIFMDEIDGIGRKRNSGDSQDHDSTLNELLVNLDGFKSTNGIFLMGATNRMDLLDDALVRPGRIDKKIYVNNPDKQTREAIIGIHLKGKPYQFSVPTFVDMTNGYSGAQIENILNEAMLYALRQNRESITMQDIEIISNRILVGFQSTAHVLTKATLYQVAVHEMGHALVAYFTKHKKIIKVTINVWSPTSLGFTLFEPNDSLLTTKESLMHELMVLLGGRIAEDMICGTTTTGATHDFLQAKKLAEKMIVDYGMGNHIMIPHGSERFRELMDQEIDTVLATAYDMAKTLLLKVEPLVKSCADVLVKEHVLKEEDIRKLMD
jgi:cell division protease FtsH